MKVMITGERPNFVFEAKGGTSDIVVGLISSIVTMLNENRKPHASNDDLLEIINGLAKGILSECGVEKNKDDKPVPEVKRKAKVGEYIKIVDAHPISEQKYKNGDVFKITHMNRWFSDACTESVSGWFEIAEYVVLEGYTDEMFLARRAL